MFLILILFSILEAKADQPVIQYDHTDHAHFTTPHRNKLRLEKHLVILPKVSHQVDYLSNPFRRDVDIMNFDASNIKPVVEPSSEPPTATPVSAAQNTDLFSNLNLNYEVPSYSTPQDFQDSVNALTHLMINKQTKFPGTSYGVPVTETPEQIKQSTTAALLKMLIGLDKEKKQNDMLGQILQFMHKKKMQQEHQSLVAQLQQQMQKEQYKPLLQSQEQAEGLITFMQQLLQPLKQQQAVGTFPAPSSTLASNFISHTLPLRTRENVPNVSNYPVYSTSKPAAEFDWIPTKPMNYNNQQSQTQQQFAFVTPTKPTYQQNSFLQPQFQSYPPSIDSSFKPSHQIQPHGKDGYIIKLSKPTIMKEELPASTSMPKIVHHYIQPTLLESETNAEFKNFKNYKDYKTFKETSQSSASTSHSDLFSPKFEHYIMKHQGEKSKPFLIKLNEENKGHKHESFDLSHSPSTKFPSKYSSNNNHQLDVVKIEEEFSNGLNHLHHRNKKQPSAVNHQHHHEVLEALKFDDSPVTYDFVNDHGHHGHEGEMHIHSPYAMFNNHEFEQEFLKDFDHMHFKKENIPSDEEKKGKKPSGKGAPSPANPKGNVIILRKVTKRA